jgi:hypothetical protein
LTESEASSGAPAAPGPDSAFGRIIGVFLSPVRTFRAIAAKPTWLAPLILWTAIAFLLAELVTTRTDMRSLIVKRMQQQNQKLSDDQLDMIVERARKFSWIGEVAWLILPAVFAGATAGVLWAGCHSFGLEVRFKQAFGITVHAFLPHVLGAIALFAILWGKMTIDPQTVEDMLPTHLGGFVSRTGAPALHSLMASLDLVSIWTMILLVLGFSAATKASRGRIAALVVSIWVLWVLGRAGLAAIFA